MPNPENLIGKGFDKNPGNINRNGRPEGVKSRSTVAKQILDMLVTIPDKQLKKFKEFWPELPQQVTGEEMITYAALYRALKRDMSYKILMDSRHGAPKQEMDMVGEIKITDHRLTIEVVKPSEDED